MTSKVVVITRPSHDPTTRYLSAWAEATVSFGRQRMHSVIDLARERANRREFESVIRRKRPTGMFLHGHGSTHQVCGHENEPLLDVGDNLDLTQGTVTYAVSCQSARILGRKAVRQGARAYIGYTEDFLFMYDTTKITRPLQDTVVHFFLKPVQLIAQTLVKGHAAREAHERGRLEIRRAVRQLLSSRAAPDHSSLVPLLLWNHDHQVCLGNPGARL